MANGHAESDEKPKRIDGPLLLSPDDIYELPGNKVSSGLHPSDIDMEGAHGQPDELISRAVERYYVGAKIYLIPELFGNAAVSPSTLQRYGRDWGANARGIYYRHHYSPEWVTADHSLWLPSFRGMEWDDASEADRRLRAKLFLRHNLDNERWGKSEYSWEADAWTDVFGGMRNDPVLAV
ncbi:hypothetical protein HMPREF1624_06410 [Sporothrix schenckii ATCC 58251]|uniref:Uncharacterized protein n=1 Tax=Sporothrix schenckii (strain ATCC 58251 / de Perez 2211183) TaxID=1391915 RepID=U7PQ73_SPOS1|nr:hypothetical protein HMPREF1624_06410 [Sporothrix schenckii ATCC 58251]